MNDETTLLPCPFCGGKAALRMSWMGDGHRYRAVECVECGATTPGNYSEVGDQSAWDWNTRTPEQAIAATVGSEREKRLEKLVRIYGEIGNYFCERFACCDAEFANCKYCIGLPQGGQCELGWCNDESKALGIEQPDYGGGECEPVNLEELYDRIGELENELAERDTLTAEQVREAVMSADRWEKPMGSTGLTNTHLIIRDDGWQAIADELNRIRK